MSTMSVPTQLDIIDFMNSRFPQELPMMTLADKRSEKDAKASLKPTSRNG